MPQAPGEPWRPPEPWHANEPGGHESPPPPEHGQGHAHAVPADMRQFFEVLQTTTPWGTWLIIAICCGVYLLTGDKGFSLLKYGAQQNQLVFEGQWWRLLSATFIHFGLIHLFVNMYSLYNIGPILEKFYGNLAYLALYGVSGLAGSLATLWLGGNGLSGGASGAIFGLCGAIVVMGYHYRDEIPDSVRRGMTAGMLPVIGYNLFFGFVGNQVARSTDLSVRIGNAAHLGGLVAGVAFAFLVSSPKMRPRPSWKMLAPLMLVLAAAPFAAEAMALWSARPAAAAVACVDPSGWSFQRPATLMLVPSKSGHAFLGDGYEIHVNSEVQDRVLPSVEAGRTQMLADLERNGFSIKSSRISRYGDRSWLVGDGTTPAGDRTRVALTTAGKTAYMVVMLGDPGATGVPAFEQILDSFKTPPGP